MAERYLLFKIAEKEFLLSSECVYEIVINQKIFKLPFVPDSVSGVIDFRGTPFTVVKPEMLLGNSTEVNDVSADHIILFRSGRGKTGILVSSVEDMVLIPETDFSVSNEPGTEFFNGFAECNSKLIPVVNPEKIEEKLRSDLAAR